MPVLHQKMMFSSVMVGLSFYLSSLLNFFLAKLTVVSSPGTDAFNQELGTLTALSFPVIALPSTLILLLAVWLVIRYVMKETGFSLEDIVKTH